MNNKKINILIRSIKADINSYNHLLNKLYNKREEVDVDVTEDQYGNEVVDVDAYHIDIEIKYLKGSIGASEHIMQMLKESINNNTITSKTRV